MGDGRRDEVQFSIERKKKEKSKKKERREKREKRRGERRTGLQIRQRHTFHIFIKREQVAVKNSGMFCAFIFVTSFAGIA